MDTTKRRNLLINLLLILSPSAFVLFFCLVLLILLPAISLEPTAVPKLASQPTLQPIADYVPGLSEIPPGKYLFVEYWSIYDGVGHCGLMAVDFPSYFYGAHRQCLRR